MWVTTEIIERIGTVNYNVLVNYKNKHASQMKRRFGNEVRINSTHLYLEMFDLHNILSVSQDCKSDSNLDVLNHSSLEVIKTLKKVKVYTINLKRNLQFTPRLIQ